MENIKFIRTSEQEVRNKLIELGYTEIPEQNSKTFCFLNNGNKMNFNVEKKDIVFTNILHL